MAKMNIVAVYGSPRRKGNTATLLKKAVEGARLAGAQVEEFVLRDLKLSPCLEIYGCKKNGECAIADDFQMLRDRILSARGLMLASPIFFIPSVRIPKFSWTASNHCGSKNTGSTKRPGDKARYSGGDFLFQWEPPAAKGFLTALS